LIYVDNVNFELILLVDYCRKSDAALMSGVKWFIFTTVTTFSLAKCTLVLELIPGTLSSR
jgi:hypothetical protein